jgi:intein/homing endonuclease
MKPGQTGFSELFYQFRDSIMRVDPVYFCANYLRVDGKPLELEGTGYKPFADIYRYIALKAIEQDAKPIVLVKGRQVGATTMAAALECYFTACGMFGTSDRPPMRLMHLFPTLSLAAAYTKDKLDPIIGGSTPVPGTLKNNGLPKSFMENAMDLGSPTNNNMHFKKFLHGNQIWIESTGLDGDRVRGRQLCLDTELPTPDRGFIKLRDLKEGDLLFDEKGESCTVTKIYPIQESPESYRVIFDDGTTIDACAEHLWLTHTRRDRINARKGKANPKVKNTKEILETLKTQGESNHCIPVCGAVRFEKKDLPIDPYLLGLWLGDGSRYGNIETADPEVLVNFEHRVVKSSTNHVGGLVSKSNSYRVKGLTTALKNLGLIDNPGKIRRDRGDLGFYKKVIPDEYMLGSVEQRLALVQGLMDSDGCCNNGRCEFVQCESRKELAMQFVELLHSLGIKTSLLKSESFRYSVQYQDRYRIQFCTTLPVFRLQRKLKNLKSKLIKAGKRFIKKIVPIDSKPMRCITVDSPSHLYLVTRSYIATHNTCDVAMFDECFPYNQLIQTDNGKIKIGKLYDMYSQGKELPLIQTYNELLEKFEYKKILNVWNRGERDLVLITLNNRKIKCTPNHPFLTINGWVKAENLVYGDLIMTSPTEAIQVSKHLNDDQYQIVLGSFLGDGHLSNHGVNRYRLIEQHGMLQKNYAMWKADMFNTNISIIEKNGFSQKPAVRFSTKIFGLQREFPASKTHCPQWVLDELDERGLAIWFMDDGTKIGVINTCSFDEDSQKRMVEKLKSMGIDCEYRWYYVKKKEKGYFSIYINKSGKERLFDLIGPYIHEDLQYKIDGYCNNQYNWNSQFHETGLIPVKSVNIIDSKETVYDIEVEDNHNFIACSVRNAKDNSGVIVHNCQDMSDLAIGAVTKILAQSRYGSRGEGVQVYFGTPKTKGGSYWEMWQNSSQNYFHLRCERCGEYFPLYRPDTNWESVWLYGLTVRCTHCHYEQDKLEAQERGKWVPLNDPDKCDFIGYHINQLYIPRFTKETIEKAKPERSPINTERVYMNEVLGEFYDGEGGTITSEEIREKCVDKGRRMVKYIHPDQGKRVYAGFDWGQRGALEQMTGRGRRGGSYSCAVILTAEDNLFNIEFATRLMKADPETKEGAVEEMFRRYNMNLAVGDIGDAYDLTHRMQRTYDEKFLASRAQHRVVGHVKYSRDEWPKTIVFEKDYYIAEILALLKDGRIKFPGGHHHKIGWLIEHCASMDIKVTKDKSGEPIKKYVKGSGANDGLMALLNAYLAWKFDVTQGFTIANPLHMKYEIATDARPIQAVVGYIPRMFGGRG